MKEKTLNHEAEWRELLKSKQSAKDNRKDTDNICDQEETF